MTAGPTLPALLALAVVLAGCGVPAGPAPGGGAGGGPGDAEGGGGAPGTDPGAPTFHPSVRVAQHDGFGFTGEPAVAVAPDGRFYVAAPYITLRDFLADGIVVQPGQGGLWRSDDGSVFQRLGDDDGWLAGDHSSTSDTDVAVDAHGRIHFVVGGDAGRILHSDDGGATWTDGGAVEPRGHSLDRPWIHAWGDGGVLANWVVRGDGSRTVAAKSSDDGGATWRGPLDLASGVLQAGAPAVAPDGGAAYQPYVDAGRALHVLVWHGGDDWTDAEVGHVLPPAPAAGPPAAPPTAVFPVAAVDAAGNAYVAWSEYREDGSTRLAWTRSRDGGATWDRASRLTDDGNALMPWLVAGDAGRVALFLLAAATDGDPNVGTHEWRLRVLSSSDADGADPTFTAADVTPEPVHVGSVCPYGSACVGYVTPFVGDRSLLDYFEAALGPDGGLAVAWTETHAQDGRNPDVRFARQSGGLRLVG